MPDDNRSKWNRLPKINIDGKSIKKHARKVENATTRHAHKFIINRWSNVREVQRHVILWVIIMGLLIAATGLQLMWYQKSYRTTTPSDSGTYAEAVIGPINTLNPLFASTSAEQSASYLMFSRLLRYDKTGHLNYDLVNDIKINEAHTVYTVSIRPDVKWHDGTKLTAGDIAFTIDLIKNPNVRSTITGWDDITVKAVDNATIQFTLKSTYAAFEHALTFPIVPKHKLSNVAASNIRENSFSQSPIGSGPFKLRIVQNAESTSGHKVISMDRNDNYYNGKAKLARFQLHAYSTNDEINKALSQSEVNAAADLSSVETSQIDSKRYNVSYKPVQSGVYAIINMKSSLLNDINLRNVLRLATNTETIRTKLPSGNLPLDLPITDNQITGETPKAPQYNLVEAKKILDDNGWKLNAKNIREKDGKLLKLSVVTMKDSEFEVVLSALASQWRGLGIEVETKVVNPADVTQNVAQNILQTRNYDVLLYQLNIGADPDVYAYWHSSQISNQGLNFSNYSNAIADDALVSARDRIEPVLRNAKYLTFVKRWLADVPAIGLYQSTAQYVNSINIHSIDKSVILVSAIDRYSDVLDWSVGEKDVYKTP